MKVHENLFPELILEEVLSDGSTVTNPPADHRKLFLGEDGLFHLRDSAGTITTPGGSTSLDALLASSAGEDIADALAAATGPDAGNPFATMADVGGTVPIIIRGHIAANGAITAGTGFTVTKGGTGIYTINFTSAFSVAPVVLVSGTTDNVTYSSAPYLVSVAAGNFVARVREAATNGVIDAIWTFVAFEV